MEGWIKLHRKMLKWEWLDEPKTVSLFIVLLLLANHQVTNWRGETIKKGQVLTGRKQLAKMSGMSEQSVRTAIKHLKMTQEITIKSTHKFSVITLVNWDQHQGNGIKLTNKLTKKQPSPNQPLTTSNNVKKEKNIYKEFSHIGYLEEMKKHHAKHIKIIALFIIAKGIILTDKEMAQRIIKRNSRTAQTLTKYKILEVDDVMKEAEKLDKKFKWSLEYILKCLEQN